MRISERYTKRPFFCLYAKRPAKARCIMNSFMSWIGGKKALRDEIVVRFPAHYSRYIEVFGGGGWVLFHKAPGKDFEVYNDFNANLVNLYRCVRDNRSSWFITSCFQHNKKGTAKQAQFGRDIHSFSLFQYIFSARPSLDLYYL